jgi:hypothetical protein
MWIFAMILAFTVVALRSRKGARAHLLLLGLIVGVVVYEAAALGTL